MQDYTLKSLKISDFKDDHDNTWCDAIFAEYGEPVKWVLKEPLSIREGVKYFGHVEVKTSKAGKPYNRFYRDKLPETAPATTGAGSTWVESPEKQESINRSVSLNNAVLSALHLGLETPAQVLDVANTYLAWLTSPAAPVKSPEPEYDEKDIG